MSELEDKINGILGDPAQIEKIAGLAKSLMGGSDSGIDHAEKTKSAGGGLDSLMQSLGGSDSVIDPAMLARLSRAFSSGAGEKKQERALLEAMKPYLSEKRRSKMDKAIKLARLASIARIAMGEMGGDSSD